MKRVGVEKSVWWFKVNNVYVKTIRLKTYGPNALFDISGEIAKAVEESGIRKGVVVVFSHGSTGSLVRLKDCLLYTSPSPRDRG